MFPWHVNVIKAFRKYNGTQSSQIHPEPTGICIEKPSLARDLESNANALPFLPPEEQDASENIEGPAHDLSYEGAVVDENQINSTVMHLKALDSTSARRDAHTRNLEEILRLKCSYGGDVLTVALTEGRVASRNANWASLLFSTTPIAGAFSKWPVRIYFIIVSLLALYQVFTPSGSLSILMSKNSFTASHFRLSVWQLREADVSSLSSQESGLGSTWGVSALGLTLNACALDLQTSSARGAHLYLSFEEQVTANGFSFRTLSSADSLKFDAVGFDMAYCDDASALEPWQCPEEKWLVVGSSDCRFRRACSTSLVPVHPM